MNLFTDLFVYNLTSGAYISSRARLVTKIISRIFRLYYKTIIYIGGKESFFIHKKGLKFKHIRITSYQGWLVENQQIGDLSSIEETAQWLFDIEKKGLEYKSNEKFSIIAPDFRMCSMVKKFARFLGFLPDKIEKWFIHFHTYDEYGMRRSYENSYRFKDWQLACAMFMCRDNEQIRGLGKLSDCYTPNVETRRKADFLDLNADEEWNKFKQYHKENKHKYQSQTWQDLFHGWLVNAFRIKQKVTEYFDKKRATWDRPHPMTDMEFHVAGREIPPPAPVKHVLTEVDRMFEKLLFESSGIRLDEYGQVLNET